MRMRGGRGSGNQEGKDEVVGRMQGGEVLKREGGAVGVKENGRKKRGMGVEMGQTRWQGDGWRKMEHKGCS